MSVTNIQILMVTNMQLKYYYRGLVNTRPLKWGENKEKMIKESEMQK